MKREEPRTGPLSPSAPPLLYTVLQLIFTIGNLHALLQTVIGEVYELWYMLQTRRNWNENSKQKKEKSGIATYAIEPQEKPTRRKPSSDMESADGAPNPSVISFVGTIESLRLHLKRLPDVEK